MVDTFAEEWQEPPEGECGAAEQGELLEKGGEATSPFWAFVSGRPGAAGILQDLRQQAQCWIKYSIIVLSFK